jgi:hypothetical protein
MNAVIRIVMGHCNACLLTDKSGTGSKESRGTVCIAIKKRVYCSFCVLSQICSSVSRKSLITYLNSSTTIRLGSGTTPTMPSRVNIFASTALRGLQILFSHIVIGLSVTLVKNHNNHGGEEGYPGPPTILPLSTGIGTLSLVAAVFSLAIAWTNCLREYIEMMVDMVVIAANVVAGTVRIAQTPRCEEMADIGIDSGHQS